MKLFRRSFIVLMVIGLAASGVFWHSLAQNKLTKAQVLTGLNAQKDASGKRTTITQRNATAIKFVQRQGVNFPLTEEAERDLREAGASDELIQAIKENSPPIPRTNPAETPKPNPTSTPQTNSGGNTDGKTFKNSIGMEFVKIPNGSFQMGSPTSEEGRDENEVQRRVTISKSYWLGKYEVTIGEWKAVMGDLPEGMKKDLDAKFYASERQPVVLVSWEDVQEFIRKLNAKGEGIYRLPTEAEWEYAARGGKTTAFSFGGILNSSQANFDGNYPYGNVAKGKYLEMTTPVGSYQANNYGLYDMHGNVWEWCNDWYGTYPSGAVADPTGAKSGSLRVVRGGSWRTPAQGLRSAIRRRNAPSDRLSFLGFRLLREL